MRIEDLASVYANLLNNKHFNIKVNSNLDFDDESIVQGIIFAARRPFSITGLNSETMELNFEFYVNVKNEQIKLDTLKEISKILGSKKGVFESENNTYTYNSFLEFARPVSAPIVDMGNFTQVVLVNGTCFVSSQSSGIEISNDIETYLTFKSIKDRVYLQSGTTNNVRDLDAPTKANHKESSAKNKTQGVARNLNIISMRNSLCTLLKKYIEVADEDYDINEEIIIEKVYPDFTITKTCVITNATLIEEAGTPLLIQLTLQTK